MSGTIDGQAKLTLPAVANLDPIHLFEVHDVVAAEADGDARLLEPQPQKIVDIALDLFLEFADATAVESPALIAVIQRDDHAAVGEIQAVDADQIGEDVVMALADVFGANFVRKAAELGKPDIADHVATVAEKHAASLALAFADFRVARPTQRVDEIAEDLFGLGDALLRHQSIGILRGSAGSEDRNGKHSDDSKMDGLYPHKIEPPFTLMISPVMKLARSEATKRMGPAISSAVAARPRGMTVEAIFWPAFVSSTGTDMSVETQPGATEFTRILCRASSVARPLVRLMMPPLEAP